MIQYPDGFITTLSGPSKDIYCKTFQVKITDNVQTLNSVNASYGGSGMAFGNAGLGNATGLKSMLPGDATIAGISVYELAQSNTGGTGPVGNLVIGRSVPFVSITATGATTATVKCAFAHALTASDVIQVSNTGVATFNTVATNGSIQNIQPATVTPSSTDPTVFTYTIPSTTIGTVATIGLIVCTSFYLNTSVLSGGMAAGYNWPVSVKNIGSFSATLPAAYWGATPSPKIPVEMVSPKLDATIGGDGNYNYYTMPVMDQQMFAYYQEYATSGFTAATTGGPWTVFVFYFR